MSMRTDIRHLLINSNVTGRDSDVSDDNVVNVLLITNPRIFLPPPQPGGSLWIATGHSDDLANRIDRSRVLLATSTLLQHNMQMSSCESKSFEQDLISASDCLPKYPVRSCNRTANSEYRPVDGKLNDRCKHTGKSFEPYGRLEKAHYSDCLWDMRKSKSRNALPKPRLIVNGIFRHFRRQITPNTRLPNYLAAMMGQYIAHDIGSRVNVQTGNETIQCCSANNEHPVPVGIRHRACCPIEIPENDPDYKKFPNFHCINMIRSEIMAKDMNEMTPAQQLNEVTAFLDNSNLYGNEKDVMDSLRTGIGGQMVTNSGNILPERDNSFYLGDGRLNQTPQLQMLHSIYLREHNRIAKILATLNPHWDDNRIFEETRRIVVAQFQHVVYKEFLPAFIDPCIMDSLNDPVFGKKLDALSFNEFNGAVFRTFHSFIPTKIQLINQNGSYKTLLLNDVTFNQQLIRTNYDEIARGLLMQPLNADGYDPNLFHGLFSKSADSPGTDLLSIDLTRGRDHGMPPYVTLLRLLKGTRRITKFRHLSPHISEENIQLLRENYESVEDIDLLAGALLETPLNGTLLGPTTQLMMAQQFLRLKSADPYFYTNPSSPKPFSARQLKQIKKANTNLLFCLNSGVESVPDVPSFAPLTSSNIRKCSALEKISYESWQEKSGTSRGERYQSKDYDYV